MIETHSCEQRRLGLRHSSFLRHLAFVIRHSLACSLFPLTLVIILSGCALGPNYKRPPVESPANYRFASSLTTNSLADLPWWQVFKDPVLQELIGTALTNNYDLMQAVARVEQARQIALATRAQLFPQVGYNGAVGRGQNSLLNTPTPNVSPNGDALTASSALLMLNATWEIDIWGRIRRLSQAARAQYLATDEARIGVTISLVSEVATAYFQLLQYDEELQIQREATNAYSGTYRIFNEKRINGVSSRLETDRALAALANAAAVMPQLELQIATTENQLNVLLGHNPGPIPRGTPLTDTQMPPEVPVGLPSALLQRRPDVLASEQTLIAASATIGANLANFFPQIGLTTFLGKVSPELSAFTAGSANAWNVGATMIGPVFQGGQLLANYRASKASFDEAKAAYEQNVLTAFQDVSNALIAREKLAEVRLYDQQATSALSSSVQVATERYMNGRSSYYEVLEAQQELYPTQRALAQARASELIALVQLYKALGGGWQMPGNEAEKPR
jgi:outer membrane protein, multidrug efflux system